MDHVHVHGGGARNRTRSSVASSCACYPSEASCRTFTRQPKRRAFPRCKRSAIMSGSLNADAPVTAVACVDQALRRFGDARVVLEDILGVDSNDSVPGMPSRMAAPLRSPATSGMSDTSAQPPTATVE